MNNVGLLSDLHLEGSNMDIINPGWDALVIAGDLSTDLRLMYNFFDYKLPSNIPIVYVLGNHEYEGRRVEDTPSIIKSLLKPFKNVHVLSNESIIINGVKFIGSTLWSNFEYAGMHEKVKEMQWAKFNVSDFTYIFSKNEDGKYVPITPEKMEKLNIEAYNFINYELTKNPFNGKKVVVTHFAPHKNSINENFKKTMNGYWINNFDELMGFSDFWFHGHTHSSFNYMVEGTNVICNPRGHSKNFNLAQNLSFDKELIISLEKKLIEKPVFKM